MSRRRERPYDDLPDEAEEGRGRKSRRRDDDSPAAARRRSRSRSGSRSPRRHSSDASPPARSDRPSRRRSSSRSRSPRRSASPTRSRSPPAERGGRDAAAAAEPSRDRGRDRSRDWDDDRYGKDRRRDRSRDRGRDYRSSPDRRGGGAYGQRDSRDRRDGGAAGGGGSGRQPYAPREGYGGGNRGGRGGKERWGYNAYLKEEGGGGEGAGNGEQQQQQQQQEKRKGRGFGGGAGGGGGPRDAGAEADGAAAAAAGEEREPAAAGGQNGAAGEEKEAAEFLQKKAAVSGRAGGAYIPPFRLARMMAEIDDKNSAAAQKLSWEALRKSLNGLINKVNAPNIKEILPELFGENLLRGRGLFCQALMKAQLASPAFTPLYAALVAVVNTKFPEIGELLLHRVIAQFKRAYKRNDKPITIAAAKFLAHLINQGVLHEVLALEMLILLLENPSDDSVEMAVDFCKEVGAHLQDVAPAGLHSVFERFRAILHEGAIDKRCQYMIEGLFAVRKAGFAASGQPSVRPELDLVEDEDQITHEMSLEDKHDPQAILNVFREDPEYATHEAQYRAIARELLGDESDEEGGGEDGEGGEGGSSEEEDSDSEGGGGGGGGGGGDAGDIEDETGTDVVNLRRTIYLTIMSSLDFEEAGHKLMKITLRPGQECEIPIMIIECCSQEKTFVRYYALLGSRFCMLRKEFQATFEDCFAKQYSIIHRLETNKLRNVAKLFAHLLANDAISWGVLGCIRLTEDDTTSSSRIFIKYLFQELSEYLGLVKLNERLAEPSLQEYFTGIFPQDTMQNMRFSINFFTSIGLGGITDRQRALYKEMPRIMAERKAAEDAARKAARGGRSSSESGSSSSSDSGSSSSSSGSSSSSSGSDSSSSDSESEDSRDRRRRRRRSSSRDGRRR